MVLNLGRGEKVSFNQRFIEARCALDSTFVIPLSNRTQLWTSIIRSNLYICLRYLPPRNNFGEYNFNSYRMRNCTKVNFILFFAQELKLCNSQMPRKEKATQWLMGSRWTQSSLKCSLMSNTKCKCKEGATLQKKTRIIWIN